MSTPGTRLSEKFKLKARLSLETGSGGVAAMAASRALVAAEPASMRGRGPKRYPNNTT